MTESHGLKFGAGYKPIVVYLIGRNLPPALREPRSLDHPRWVWPLTPPRSRFLRAIGFRRSRWPNPECSVVAIRMQCDSAHNIGVVVLLDGGARYMIEGDEITLNPDELRRIAFRHFLTTIRDPRENDDR